MSVLYPHTYIMKKLCIITLCILFSSVVWVVHWDTHNQLSEILPEDSQRLHIEEYQSAITRLSATQRWKRYILMMDSIVHELWDDRERLAEIQENFHNINLYAVRNTQIRDALLYLRVSIDRALQEWVSGDINVFQANPHSQITRPSGRHQCETETVRIGEYEIASCNVGATSTDVTSSDSFWYIYQWGSNYAWVYWASSDDVFQRVDSRPCPSSGCEMHYFITTLGHDHQDWSYPHNDNLWGGNFPNVARPSAEAQFHKRWVCPEWFHIPTQKQWQSVIESLWDWMRGPDLTQSELNLPFAGYRISNAVYSDLWARTPYWTSTPHEHRVHTLFLSNHIIGIDNHAMTRANAYPVRCFKNF